MTPDRAAELLAVSADATPAEIERAFARAARQSHPDLFVDDDDAARAGHAADFAELAQARDVLVVRARARAAARAAAASTGYVPPAERAPSIAPPPGRYLLSAWIGLLVLAAFLGTYGTPHPATVVEPLARWAILGAALVGFGVTGRRPLLIVAVVALLATVVVTVVFTSLGGLLSLLAVLVPVLGLSQAGLAAERRRARAAAVDN